MISEFSVTSARQAFWSQCLYGNLGKYIVISVCWGRSSHCFPFWSDPSAHVHADSVFILTVYDWHLISLLSPITSLHRVLHSQTSANVSKDWLRCCFGPSFPISKTESTSILGKLYHYLIIPIPNFYNHNQNHLLDLQRDVLQSQAELSYGGK